MLKIGLIQERKKIPDTRVALTPSQCRYLLDTYPNIQIVVEASAQRCYTDEEYKLHNIPVVDNINDCDILLGIKEVPIDHLIADKTYFFFSHTIKKQPYNRGLMQALIAKRVKMIDYETLTYDDGARIIGFGFFAGVVGAHNALLIYGMKSRQYTLIPAHLCKDKKEMLQQYNNVTLPPMKIVVTGSGKVTNGVLDILHAWDVKGIDNHDFLTKTYDYPVYTQLKAGDLYRHKETNTYDRNDFYLHPEKYKCIFEPYTQISDILIHGIFWNDKIDIMFPATAITASDFNLGVIADITCDPFGSIPINVGASTIAAPVYGIARNTRQQTVPFLPKEKSIDVMAVDNLPNELPRDASEHFGEHMIKYIIPELLKDQSAMLERATICQNGKLSTYFEYLSDYANETT
jgi:saccharopine dehydrogenase (NAD+, L-lysine-forming)